MLPRLAKPPAAGPVHVSEFPFTNHRITLNVFSERDSVGGPHPVRRWFPLRALASVPVPSPHRRALEALIKHA